MTSIPPFRLLLLFGGLLVSLIIFASISKDQWVVLWRVPQPQAQMPSLYQSEKYLNSVPTMHFRDNIVDGVRYVTAWPVEGFTNQFMSQINLIYLSGIANRVPVLPSFVPSRHMNGKPRRAPLPFSQVFDLPRLAKALHRPILEWKDVKNTSSREVEDIGCWSVFGTLFGNGPHFQSEQDLALDVSLTKVPESSKISPSTRSALNIVSLASLGWQDTREDALMHASPSPSPQRKHTLPPDEVMLCYDNLYYVATAKEFEWETAWSPSWNLVGRHANYNPVVEQLAREYILRAFRMAADEPFPTYISVHARRTDFSSACGDRPAERCFPPLSVYAAAVKEVKAEIMAARGINVEKVLLASDEENQTWWNEAHEMGWERLDHEKEHTEEIHGPWYPAILDTVALSLGKGFVGTRASTLSLLASKRAQLWGNGIVRTVDLIGY